MRQLNVELGERSYPILIGAGLLGSAEKWPDNINRSQTLVVTNPVIESLYLSTLQGSLQDQNAQTLVLPEGESHKTLDTINDIITALLENKFSRTGCLIALGGGVIGDMTGFAAACYQRGIDYIQVPTTLLAQVDSSVGGKTAVNHPLGKNMIGAFHQPVAVLIDTNVLKTLPQRELSAGLAEVIKYGLIRDKEFFSWLEENIEKLLDLDADALEYAIERSCINKAEVVSADEKETGIRAILNLGHTFGHAIETAMNYSGWLHGEAVGLGMLMAADLSCRLGMIDSDCVGRTKALLERAKLPTCLPAQLANSDLRELMSVDKKSRHGKLFLVLLNDIGDAVVTNEFDEQRLKQLLADYARAAGTKA